MRAQTTMNAPQLKCAASWGALLLTAVVSVRAANFGHPARFGVIDVIPNELSAEWYQDWEPSLGAGLNSNYGKMAVHTFSSPLPSTIYASANTGDAPWAGPWSFRDYDATMDWSPGGSCYLAVIPVPGQVIVRKSPDPTITDFSTINTSTIAKGQYPWIPDQPWVRTVTVNNVDHIFVAYNDASASWANGGSGQTATVRYSLDGGVEWRETVIDRLDPGTGWDSPAVRLAPSSDGKTVYALFQRASSWTGNAFASDFAGDVVLVRDDYYGGSSFASLGTNGTLVANNVVLPWSTSLGAQRLGSGCDVAVHPSRKSQVYVAFTTVLSGTPVVIIESSNNSGATFDPVYGIANASLPALAVSTYGTVGLLCAAKNGSEMEIHFLKAFAGDFSKVTDRVLAKFPDSDPSLTSKGIYLGDYFNLRAVGWNFFGTFSAPNDPNPKHFPSGVFYQRTVRFFNGVYFDYKDNFWLNQPGTLVDLGGNVVRVSIDPFFFYDIAGAEQGMPANFIPAAYSLAGDPLLGQNHLSWPMLPSSEPQFELQTAGTLGPQAHWTVPTASQGVSIIQTNGQNFATFVGSDPQRFFRLQQNLVGNQFLLFASADGNGSLVVAPGSGVLGSDGIMTNPALSSVTFVATPTNNYYVDKWYLDGIAVQSNAPSLTVSNIASEHTVVMTFNPSNDLAVTVFQAPGDEGPTETGNTNTYVIEIANKGLNTLTGVSMTDTLDATVGLVLATTSQGTVDYVGGQVVANIGSLRPGGLVTVNIQFVPFFAANITDTANVVCDQPEPDLANNFATISTLVIDPVIITNQPASITVRAGSSATFTVGASGTPPFTYQWFFNGTNLLNNATSATLTLTNVSTARAGTYSATVLQVLGPEAIEGDNSILATLTVQ